MSAAFELPVEEGINPSLPSSDRLVLLLGRGSSGGWQREVRELFARGAVQAARALVEALPRGCDGPDRERWRAALQPARVVGASPASGGTAAGFAWLAREGHQHQGEWVFVDGGRFVDGDADLKQLRARHPGDEARNWTLIWVEGPE